MSDIKISETELQRLPGPIAENPKPEGCTCDVSYHAKLNPECERNIAQVLAMRGGNR